MEKSIGCSRSRRSSSSGGGGGPRSVASIESSVLGLLVPWQSWAKVRQMSEDRQLLTP